MTLRYDVQSWVCFDTWFLRVRYGVKRTQPACLLEAAELPDTLAHGLLAKIHVSTYAAGGQLTPNL